MSLTSLSVVLTRTTESVYGNGSSPDSLERVVTWGLLEKHLANTTSILEQSLVQPNNPNFQRFLHVDSLGCDVDSREGVLERLREFRLPSAGRDSPAIQRIGEYELEIQQWRGLQDCPWGCPLFDDITQLTTIEEMGLLATCRAGTRSTAALPATRYASIDFELKNSKANETVSGPGLIIHLIRAHQFFEGRGSPYRTDPERLCSVLGLLE